MHAMQPNPGTLQLCASMGHARLRCARACRYAMQGRRRRQPGRHVVGGGRDGQTAASVPSASPHGRTATPADALARRAGTGGLVRGLVVAARRASALGRPRRDKGVGPVRHDAHHLRVGCSTLCSSACQPLTHRRGVSSAPASRRLRDAAVRFALAAAGPPDLNPLPAACMSHVHQSHAGCRFPDCPSSHSVRRHCAAVALRRPARAGRRCSCCEQRRHRRRSSS